MRVMVLIKATALKGVAPGECMRHVNSLLCPDNDSAMFVTVFYGVLDTKSGDLVYSNAGHNLPYLLRARGAIEPVHGTGGMALGVMEDLAFETRRARLGVGDALFLYTDGITEAMNPGGHLFSDDRLQAFLREVTGLPPSEMIHRAVSEVRAFSAGAPQSDDITILAVKRD